MQSSKTKKKKILIDSAFLAKEPCPVEFDLDLADFVKKHKKSSWLFSKEGRTDSFLTESSGLYFLQDDLKKLRKGEKILKLSKKLDCFMPQEIREELEAIPEEKAVLCEEVRKRYIIFRDYWSGIWSDGIRSFGISKAWNLSIVCSLVFGMFLMAMLYRYLGQGATAKTKDVELALKNQVVAGDNLGKVSGESDSKEDEEITRKILEEYNKMLEENRDKNSLEGKVRKMVKGYPIEKMVPEIMKKDKVVAAFLIGIAKKESDWGKHVPVLDGQDCYNYWGYRGQRDRMGTGGHTCFDSEVDAVDTVAKRIEFLVNNEEISTPEKMVTVWKCGYDCSWDKKEAVQKWIDDVDKYFYKFNDLKKD